MFLIPDPLKRPPIARKKAAVSGEGPEHSRFSEMGVSFKPRNVFFLSCI